VAVCVVGSLLYIFECSRGLNLILVYRSVIFVCDAFTVCWDYIVITCSAICFTGKDYSCFVTSNFNFRNHRSCWFFCICCSVCCDFLRTSIVFASAYSFDCCSTITISCCCIFRSININFSTFNGNLSIFNSYICICKIKFINSPF